MNENRFQARVVRKDFDVTHSSGLLIIFASRKDDAECYQENMLCLKPDSVLKF